MKNNDDIPATDTTEIKQLINRVKRGELDQSDVRLIEKLLNSLLTIVSELPRTGKREGDDAWISVSLLGPCTTKEFIRNQP